MPKRLIDSSFLDSPSMEALSPAAQDAFPRFILLADDFGCFEVNYDRLRANGWSKRPDVTMEHVAAWLHEYTTKRAPGEPPVAMMWTDRGRRYCHLTGWFGSRGQRKRAEYDPKTEAGRKGSKRHTPAPPADLLAAVLRGEVRASDGFPPGSDVFPPGNAAGSELEIPNDSLPAREIPVPAAFPPIPAALPGTQYAVPVAVAVAGKALAPSPTDSTPEPVQDDSPVAMTLPCVGNGPKEYPVRLSQIAKWQEAYPGVDVLAEVRKSLAWLEANPAKRKTHRGCPAFLVGWLNRAQDRGGGRPGTDAPKRGHGMLPVGTKFEGTPW